ncbi:MAG: lipoate--protein ligase [Spirochaetota bacterium]
MKLLSSIQVFFAKEFDPWLNLATENWIFHEMDPKTNVLFLWRNNPVVVIGRYQNPWRECNLAAMEAEGVKLARRQSGGGAVYHDLGNTNFTFMSSRSSYSKERNNEIIIAALNRLGINTEASGRNDLVVDGKKFSGSAFKLAQDRAFHHGTILINTDMGRLNHYLTPDEDKLSAKGVKSVKSRVTNLIDYNPGITHDALCSALVAEFFSTYDDQCDITYLTYDMVSSVPHLQTYYEQMADWQWRFGKTPQFQYEITKRFNWGSISVHFDTKAGMIVDTKVFSDALMPELIEDFTHSLTDIRFTRDHILEAFHRTARRHPQYEQEIDQVAQFLLTSLDLT